MSGGGGQVLAVSKHLNFQVESSVCSQLDTASPFLKPAMTLLPTSPWPTLADVPHTHQEMGDDMPCWSMTCPGCISAYAPGFPDWQRTSRCRRFHLDGLSSLRKAQPRPSLEELVWVRPAVVQTLILYLSTVPRSSWVQPWLLELLFYAKNWPYEVCPWAVACDPVASSLAGLVLAEPSGVLYSHHRLPSCDGVSLPALPPPMLRILPAPFLSLGWPPCGHDFQLHNSRGMCDA